MQNCESRQKKEVKKIKNQNARLRNNAIFGESIGNPMNKVECKICKQ